MIDAKEVKGLQFHWKAGDKIKVPGIEGYATILRVTDSSLIEGDVLYYDRVLTDQEKRCMEQYLREKMK
jgi:hypothetical protein